jgi:hypothetical protein
MAMTCFSSDSRTPLRRPSMVGRMPIFGNGTEREYGIFVMASDWSAFEIHRSQATVDMATKERIAGQNNLSSIPFRG